MNRIIRSSRAQEVTEMLGDNIRILRKEKGFTQETFAQQLNVVRQTVSKWEKGASVPDAEMLNTISEILEVPVSTLLGSIPEPETEKKSSEEGQSLEEIAKQLAVLNGQLANKAVRRKKILRGILLFLIGAFVLYVAAVVLFKTERKSSDEYTRRTLVCELDGKDYSYEIVHDQNFRIYEMGGDSYINDTVLAGQTYDDANVLISQIKLFFEDRGGIVSVFEKSEQR